MQNYKLGEFDGIQIVQNLDTKVFYLTIYGYAKMAEVDVATVERKARNEVKNNKVLDLRQNGLDGVKGRYLIPVELIFTWLMIDSPIKAVLIGTKGVAASIAEMFSNSIGE